MGSLAFAVGLAIAGLTVASQVGLLGGHDFVVVALAGFVAGVFCLIVALEARSRIAAVGAALSLLPVVLLAYFLATSDG